MTGGLYGAIHGDVDVPAHGSKDMPVWGAVFQSIGHDNGTQAQMRIANLTSYIKEIQAK